MAYIEVPAESLKGMLAAKGFTEMVVNKEVVYERANHIDPNLKVRVYTSLAVGEEKARKCGGDAIRCCLVFNRFGKTWGIAKAKRVYRSGKLEDVLDRTLERAREMYALANQFASHKCSCGAPRWLDSGRCVAKCGA